jgi:hypothetical protein
MISGDVTKSFNRLHAALECCSDTGTDKVHQRQKREEEEQVLADIVAPETSEQCISWILEAWESKDFFRCDEFDLYCIPIMQLRQTLLQSAADASATEVRAVHSSIPGGWRHGYMLPVFCLCRLLGLPAVELDALGRLTWQCTDSDVSKAYRKLAVLVHPDKVSQSTHPRSGEAFDCLNAAHRILKDPGKRADEMAKQLDQARKRRSLREAAVTGSSRVALNAQRTAEVRTCFMPPCTSISV